MLEGRTSTDCSYYNHSGFKWGGGIFQVLISSKLNSQRCALNVNGTFRRHQSSSTLIINTMFAIFLLSTLLLTNCLAVPYNAAEMSEAGMDDAAFNAENVDLAESDIISEHNAEEGAIWR
ncbi:hypothetical protein ACHWQZ_G009418 [Mnemiopsis leidyi]